jgi:hypothetical protein
MKFTNKTSQILGIQIYNQVCEIVLCNAEHYFVISAIIIIAVYP